MSSDALDASDAVYRRTEQIRILLVEPFCFHVKHYQPYKVFYHTVIQ